MLCKIKYQITFAHVKMYSISYSLLSIAPQALLTLLFVLLLHGIRTSIYLKTSAL